MRQRGARRSRGGQRVSCPRRWEARPSLDAPPRATDRPPRADSRAACEDRGAARRARRSRRHAPVPRAPTPSSAARADDDRARRAPRAGGRTSARPARPMRERRARRRGRAGRTASRTRANRSLFGGRRLDHDPSNSCGSMCGSPLRFDWVSTTSLTDRERFCSGARTPDAANPLAACTGVCHYNQARSPTCTVPRARRSVRATLLPYR